MGKFFAFLLAVGVVVAVWVGVFAILALVASWLWNYIAVETHHPDVQITFWVAWAGLILLGIIAQPFRVTVNKTDS